MNQRLALFSVFMLIFSSCESERLDANNIQQDMKQMSPLALRGNNNEVTVATYNLHLFLGPALLEDDTRQKKITEFIRNSLSINDVLYLSEIWKDNTKNEIIENLKDIYPFSIHSNAVYLNQGDGLLILSKFPIQENKFTVFTDAAGFDKFAPKGFHKTRFSTPNGDFYSFFTHTQADAIHKATRKKQLEQIKQQTTDLDGVPSIITGDLNVIGDTSNEYNELKLLFNNYQDSYRELNQNSQAKTGFTFDNSGNKLADYFYSVSSNGSSQERLDYILVSEGWKLVSSTIIDNCNYQSSTLNEIIPCSDHYGIQTTIALEKKIQKKDPNIFPTYDLAKNRINNLKSEYGTGLTAKIIIHNNTNEDLSFKNKSEWYNSTFFIPPSSIIPAGQYGVLLAVHDTGEATGVFNQLTYFLGDTKLSLGTYVPWSFSYTNNVLVGFNEITKNELETNSTRPSITKVQSNIKLTGKISTGNSPFVEFSIEKL